MGKMLRNKARELLAERYEKTHNAEEIAKIFGVNKYIACHSRRWQKRFTPQA